MLESPEMPEMPNTPLTPKMLASAFNSDSKTIRRFLRNLLATENHPGKGNRWMIDANALEPLKIQFDAWIANRAQIISIDMIAPASPEPTESAPPARNRSHRASPVKITQMP